MAFGRKIDEVRKEILGLKLIDYLEGGKVLFFEDEEGRNYSIDFTGENGAIVQKGTTEKEDIETKMVLFDLLLQKLEIDEDELWELYEQEVQS